jgi:uncharacterized protein
MKLKNIIKEIIVDFQARKFDEIISRDMEIPVDTGKIVSISGIRRSGKTYLMFDVIKKLILKGTDTKKLVYINFEDERLNIKIDELDLILQSQRELYPDMELNNCYYFFDEIQNVDGWEKFVRRLYDTVSKNIYITGSNSKLLSSEIATSLRGRTINYEVFPLSFKEYLKFKNIAGNKFDKKVNSLKVHAFNEYLFNGGYPEVIGYEDSIRDKTLQTYYQVMIYKDLTERYKVPDLSILNYFLSRVTNNLTKPTSVNKIFNELKSNGYKTSKNILYDYLEWIEAVYFTLKVQKFDHSLIKREKAEKKYYIVDNGLVNAVTYNFSKDYGKLLENLIAIHLKSEFNKNVYFYKDNVECDFLVFDRDKPLHAIQVCWDISDKDTLKREIKGLVAACKFVGLTEGVIVSMNDDFELTENDIKIKCISAINFLCD